MLGALSIIDAELEKGYSNRRRNLMVGPSILFSIEKKIFSTSPGWESPPQFTPPSVFVCRFCNTDNLSYLKPSDFMWPSSALDCLAFEEVARAVKAESYCLLLKIYIISLRSKSKSGFP